MRSWQKTVSFLLITILAVSAFFLVWTNASYHKRLKNEISLFNNQSVDLWINSTTQRLNTIHEHISDIMITIYSNTSTQRGGARIPFPVVQKIQTSMENKTTIGQDNTTYFVLDQDSDWFIFRSPQGVGNQEVIRLKKYTRSNDMSQFRTSIYDKSWFTIHIGQNVYFVKVIELGRYLAGALCPYSSFDLMQSYQLLGEESNLYFVTDHQVMRPGLSASPTPLSSEQFLANTKGEGFLQKAMPDQHTALVFEYGKTRILSQTGFSAFLLLLLVSLGALLLFFILIYFISKRITRPTKELLSAIHHIEEGDLDYRIQSDPGSQEFETMYHSFNSMADQIKHLRIETYEGQIVQQENKLRMLRAQIRPHFYLNALTTINNMTYQNRPEDIRTYLQALAKHIRYMLNIQTDFVVLEEELSQIRNYLEMQELRFPGSVELSMECPPELREVKIPYLILFTLVENTLKHALDLYKTTKIEIRCSRIDLPSFHGLSLTVKDNGQGFPEGVLESIAEASEKESSEDPLPPKEHLGLSNIQYTLRLLYQRNDLLKISNAADGAIAEVWIPDSTKGEAL